ncbi:hypothetical protein [Kineobactrum salinum]|uniref:Uncharacterized protein n=1 Tax=Kineobactrum salinum TaxID=2708301 RepID=A0A6C0U726_9GAMM|nr:hypothetical protein [Kineobactrum salinum]QIB67139.1 hypothetical protein G3T16_18775 [Kineobactrum salinum]
MSEETIVDMYNAGWTDKQVAEEALARLEKQGTCARDSTGCFYSSDSSTSRCIVGGILPEDLLRHLREKGINCSADELNYTIPSDYYTKLGEQQRKQLQEALDRYDAVLLSLQSFHDTEMSSVEAWQRSNHGRRARMHLVNAVRVNEATLEQVFAAVRA